MVTSDLIPGGVQHGFIVPLRDLSGRQTYKEAHILHVQDGCNKRLFFHVLLLQQERLETKTRNRQTHRVLEDGAVQGSLVSASDGVVH